MGICHRDFAPDLSPVEGPEVDDGSREELAEYYAAHLCDSCVKQSNGCIIEPASPVQTCVEHVPKGDNHGT